MAKHVVLRPVKHEGKIHAPGAELDLDAGVAAPLVSLGAVKAVPSAKKEGAPEKTPPLAKKAEG